MKWYLWLVLIPCAPALVAGWLLCGLRMLFWTAHKPALDPEYPFVLTVTSRQWFEKLWPYSTTIGFGIRLRASAGPRAKNHERVHVRQFMDAGLLGAVLGIVAAPVDPWLGLGLWIGGLAMMAPAFLGAVWRGGHVYFDAEHERSARAQTDIRADGAWLDKEVGRSRHL